MTTPALSTDRRAILNWFINQKEDEVRVTRFIEAFSDRLTPGQGRGDLAWLVNHDYLTKRVNWNKRVGCDRPEVCYSVTNKGRGAPGEDGT